MSLVDEARKIILQDSQTEDDIIELSKIVFLMSSLYREQGNLAAQQEEQYNLTRSKETNLAEQSGISITKASEIGKQKAEEEYGNYRSMESDCKGMKQVMDSIREFKIAWYVQNKGTTDFISNNKNLKNDL